MTEAHLAAPDATASVPVTAPSEPEYAKVGFAFTDPGCRTEIRLGTLLVLFGVFMWGWLGPAWASPLAYLGVPLILIGVPLQVRDAKRSGRPGYPWKLAIAMGVGGLLMMPDLAYRERYDASLMFQITAVALTIPGVWLLAWWPVARKAAATFRRQQDQDGVAA